jgi:uncharacterized protein with PIN domain
MNIVDSSGWLAYFADEPNAKHFLAPLKDTASLIVPVVTIYEVFKVVLRESSENEASSRCCNAKGYRCGFNSHPGDCCCKTQPATSSSNGRQYYPRNIAGI